MTVSATIGASPSEITVGVQNAAGTAHTFYRDEAVLTIGTRAVFERGTPVTNWRQIDRVLELPYYPSEGRQLRIIGTGLLSSVTLETDEMEIDDPQTRILYADAILYLLRQGDYRSPAQSQEWTERQMAKWEREGVKRRALHAMPPIPTNRSDF